MTLDEKVAEQFRELINEGSNLRQAMQANHDFPSDQPYQAFRTRALNLVMRVCGKDSVHYRQLDPGGQLGVQMAVGAFNTSSILGIVEAAHRDYTAGMLFDVRRLIEADVFDDLLEQAEHLLASGYHVAAASLGGAVLEDSLRKLSVQHSVPVPAKTKIDSLNAGLAKAGVYTKLQQKRITAITDVRNNADHGHTDQFSGEDVRRMLAEVRELLTKYFG